MIRLVLLSLLSLPAAAEDGADAPRVRSFPHNAVTARDAADPSCGVCHSAVPETGVPPDAANLRMAPTATCGMCHRGPVHYGIDEHVGVVLPEEARASLPPEVALAPDGTIQCFTCHEVHTLAFPADVQEQVAARQAGERPLASALRARALESEWATLATAGDTLRWPPSHDPAVPPLLALPIHDGTLCAACHGEGP